MAELQANVESTSPADSVDLAKPGESIRCVFTERQAKELAKRLYGLTVTQVKEFNGYDDRNFHLTVEETCSNAYIKDIWPHGYVLKIVNTLDSQKPDYFDAQSLFLFHFDQRIPGCCPLPVTNVDGKLAALETVYQEDEEGNRISETPTQHIVRLLTFKPAIIFHQIPQPDLDLFYEAGRLLGKINCAFKDFSNSSLDGRLHVWSMYRVPKLKDFTYAVRDTARRILAEEVIEAFITQVPPNYHLLQKGTIHGDFNEQNILVQPSTSADVVDNPSPGTKYQIVGVIDFGDIANACYIFEIGMTIMYLMTCSKALDLVDVGGHILAGYLSQMTLNDLELDLLRTVVAARYAQSLVLGEYFYMLDGNEYCLTTGAVGWPQLERFWSIPKETLMEKWMEIVAGRNGDETHKSNMYC